MTENTISMGGTALAEPPAPVLPGGDDDSADAGNRRKLVMVGALVGGLVLLVAAFFLFKGGDSTPVSSALPVLPHPNAAAPSTTHHQAKATKPLKLPKAYKQPIGKDPFKPLYVAPVEQPNQPADAGQGTTGTTAGTPSDPTTQPTTTTTQPTTTIGHPVWVELVKVDGTKSATFIVGYSNGQRLTTRTFRDIVAPKGATGTVFAKQFTLLSLQNGEATIQFGDGTPLDIAPGAANRVVVN